MGSRNKESSLCKDFIPHFFKPSYCINCFKVHSPHSIDMPEPSMTSNDHPSRRQGCDQPRSSTNTEVWVKANSDDRTSSNSAKLLQKPSVTPQVSVTTDTGEKKSLLRNKQTNSQTNNYQPLPKGRGCLNRTEPIIMEPKQASINIRPNGLPLQSAINNFPPTSRLLGVNGMGYHVPYDASVYEAIFPTDANIENFDNQANSVLETCRINQRSHSDAASYRRQGRQTSRPTSTPSTATLGNETNLQVFEFQKLAGRLKHTGRKDNSLTSGGNGVNIHKPQQTKTPLSRCGFSQGDRIQSCIGKERMPVSQKRNNISKTSSSNSSQIKANEMMKGKRNILQSPELPERACNKSPASSASSREVKSDAGSKTRSSSFNSSSAAPALPIRTDSKRKSNSDQPGFALESFVPDCITIISADGTREVITSNGITQTTAANDIMESVAFRGGIDTSVTNGDKGLISSTINSQIPTADEYQLVVGPSMDSKKVISPSFEEALPYEVIMVGPLESANHQPLDANHNASKPLPSFNSCDLTGDTSIACNSNEIMHQENLASQEITSKGKNVIPPPFPVILHDDKKHKTKNRHSGNYKVPIFIKHQDYDNLGTVLADQDYEAMQLNKPVKGHLSVKSGSEENQKGHEDQYYLKPKDQEAAIQDNGLIEGEGINEEEYEFVRYPQNKPDPLPVDVKNETTPLPVRKPRRTRSQTHPVVCKEGNVVLPQSPPPCGSKLKRTAPRPPGLSRDDTMPRTPPPPPPTETSRRLSKELHEGILRYHRANAAKGNNFNLNKKPQTQLVKTDMKSNQVVCSQEQNRDDMKQENDWKPGESEISKEKRTKQKQNLHVSAVKGKCAPKPMISPPRTHLIHQLNMSESPPSPSPLHEGRQKEKKSLLFWKKRKRKEDGISPEREYNTEIVTQWLEKLDEAHPLHQRHSWERMEVINAYKGQETAVIGYVGQDDDLAARNNDMADCVCAQKRKAPQPPGEVNSSSDGSSQPSPRAGESNISKPIEVPKEKKKERDGGRIATNNSDQIIQDVTSCPLKPPPRTRSQRRRRETVHETPEYVNLAFLKQTQNPPAKPRRRVRSSRSLTTGFENLPSTTKRMAPRTPDEDSKSGSRLGLCSASDSEATSHSVKNALLSPLKSAMKKKNSEVESDTSDKDAPPKRPVRLIQANPPGSESDQFGLPKSGYANLEVKQINFKGTSDDKLIVPLSGTVGILEQIQSIQCHTLTQAGQLYTMPALEKAMFESRGWEDFVVHERTLMFPDEKTFCFRAELKDHPQEFCLMVFLHEDQLDKIFAASQELEKFPPHPNMLNVVHTFRASLLQYLFNDSQDEASQTDSPDSVPSQSDAVVVITSQIPISSAVHFIEENKGLDIPRQAQYEQEVWCMLLQVCKGVAHAQKHEPELSLEGLKPESVFKASKGPQIWIFNPLTVSTLSSQTSGRRNSVVSHLTDKCCEFDLGILIYQLLHQPNPFSIRTSLMSRNYTPDDLPPLPEKSSYSRMFMTLVCELLRRYPEDRITCDQAVWIIYAKTFCQNLCSDSSDSSSDLDAHQLQQVIALKRTEVTCTLAAKLCSGTPDEFSIWEKLEFLFWSEVDHTKLERALKTLKA